MVFACVDRLLSDTVWSQPWATNFHSFRRTEYADCRSVVLPFTVFLRYDEETRPSVGAFVPTRTLLPRFRVILFYGPSRYYHGISPWCSLLFLSENDRGTDGWGERGESATLTDDSIIRDRSDVCLIVIHNAIMRGHERNVGKEALISSTFYSYVYLIYADWPDIFKHHLKGYCNIVLTWRSYLVYYLINWISNTCRVVCFHKKDKW